jgi:hypothetical protein
MQIFCRLKNNVFLIDVFYFKFGKKTMKFYLFLFCSFVLKLNLNAQLGVNSDGSLPHSSAQLDVKATNKGLLLPRVTSPQSSISSPAAGLMVYDQANANLSYFNGAGWQNLTGSNTASGLYARFPRSRSFRAITNTAAVAAQFYTFTVPAGVNTVWIEMWAGGAYGGELTTPIVDGTLLPFSGAAGDFASIIMPVTAGEILSIQVGNGGTSTANGAGNSRIIAPSGSTYEVARFQATCAYNGTFAVGEVPGLIQFVAGESGHRSTFSFEQSSATEFRRVIQGGKGGNSYLGKGGDGVQVSFLMPAGTFLSNGGSQYGFNGSTPGGGGGVGYGSLNGGYGGPGLLILHW